MSVDRGHPGGCCELEDSFRADRGLSEAVFALPQMSRGNVVSVRLGSRAISWDIAFAAAARFSPDSATYMLPRAESVFTLSGYVFQLSKYIYHCAVFSANPEGEVEPAPAVRLGGCGATSDGSPLTRSACGALDLSLWERFFTPDPPAGSCGRARGCRR